jgi:hypothetical protein
MRECAQCGRAFCWRVQHGCRQRGRGLCGDAWHGRTRHGHALNMTFLQQFKKLDFDACIEGIKAVFSYYTALSLNLLMQKQR